MKLYLRMMSVLDALSVANIAAEDDVQQATEFGFDGAEDDLAVAMYQLNGPAWTIARVADDAAVACGGFEYVRKGVYRSWFLPSETAFKDYGAEITEICRQSIDNLMESDAHRLETVSLSNRPKAHRWYESIGLTREAEHPGYGVTGQAAVTYVRIR